MIKLQDFARQQGVTDRAIQKHLKTYASELEGLYQRKGPNGTWLTDEACEILRSKMKQQPIVVGDSEVYKEKASLEKENKELLEELKEAYKMIAELRPIQARLEAAEKETKLLEGFIQDAKKEIAILNEEKGEISAELNKKDESLQKATKKAEDVSDELTEALKKIEEMKNASLMQRLFGWKKGVSR